MDCISFSPADKLQLCHWLETHQPDWSIGSIHGAISAAIACNQEDDLSQLVTHGLLPNLRDCVPIADDLEERSKTPQADPVALFDALCSSTTYQLSSTEFDYQLQLLDDDQPMAARLTTLAEWCDAFTLCYSTFALGKTLSKDTRFMLNVMAAVQSVDTHQAEQLPDDDDFETICESIRMGVISMHSEQHTVQKEHNQPTKKHPQLPTKPS